MITSPIIRKIFLLAIAQFGTSMAHFYFNAPFSLYPLIETADVIRLISPFLVLFAFYNVLHLSQVRPATHALRWFIFLAILYATAHGIHLASNSIGHLLDDFRATDIYTLTYFYDEQLSHVMWATSFAGLSILPAYLESESTRVNKIDLIWKCVAIILFGFMYFCNLVESQTAFICVPFAALFVIWASFRVGSRWHEYHVTTFFLLSYSLSLLLTLVWFLIWRGLPEFSQVGFIS